MSVVGIYCKYCGKLVGAEDTATNEREYHDRWCGKEGIDECYGCHNPFDIVIEEWEDGEVAG